MSNPHTGLTAGSNCLGFNADVSSDPRGPEMKFFDVTLVETNTNSSTGIVTQLSNVPSGVGSSQRLGRSIKVVSVSVRGYVHLEQEANWISGGSFRHILVVDTQTNGAVYVGTDLLADTVHGFKNLTKGGNERFICLRDELSALNNIYGGMVPSTDAEVTGRVVYPINYEVSDICIPIVFDGVVGDITDLVSNSISLFTSAGTTAVNVHYVARLRYFDD